MFLYNILKQWCLSWHIMGTHEWPSKTHILYFCQPTDRWNWNVNVKQDNDNHILDIIDIKTGKY